MSLDVPPTFITQDLPNFDLQLIKRSVVIKLFNEMKQKYINKIY